MKRQRRQTAGGRFVLSLGGSVIAPKEGIDTKFLKSFRALLVGQVRRGRRFVIVCGGGATARAYQRATAAIRAAKPAELDLVGIQATLLNAMFMRVALGPKLANDRVVSDPRPPLPTGRPVVVGAGWRPGCSTDNQAVLWARKFGAKTVVNLTNTAYVFDKDPRKFKDARPIKAMTWAQFRRLFGAKWRPGLNSPFDPVAALAAAKSGMTVIVADGRDLKNTARILNGEPFKGTVIG